MSLNNADIGIVRVAKVVEKRISGLFVELDTNEKAWLPVAEIKPEAILTNQKSVLSSFTINDNFKVKIIAYDFARRTKIVSKYRVEYDPWDETNDWEIGDKKELKVTCVVRNRAFGFIKNGIEGIAPFSNISNNLIANWEDFKRITAGDTILGKIVRIEKLSRFVELDFGCLLSEPIDDIWGYDQSQLSDLSPGLKKLDSETEISVSSSRAPKRHLKNIENVLVVDDEAELLSYLASDLNSWGLKVISKSSEISSIEYLKSEEAIELDLAIIDVHLKKFDDYTGLKLAQFIQNIQPQCRIIVTSGRLAQPGEYNLVPYKDLLVCGFLEKPFYSELLRTSIGESSSANPKPLSMILMGPEFSDDTHNLSVDNELAEAIIDETKNLRKKIKATSVCVFRINPVNFEVDLEAISGPSKKYDRLRHKLRFSPVKDVAIDKERVSEKFIGKRIFPKHRWLVNTFGYKSVIGAPLNVVSEYAYCLFAFYDRPHGYSEIHFYEMLISSERIARKIERERYFSIREDENPYTMAGKVYGSLGHELSSSLTTIDFELRGIQNIIKAEDSSQDNKLKLISEAAKLARGGSIKAQEITLSFRRVAGGHRAKKEYLKIHKILMYAYKSLYAELKASGIKLKLLNINKNLPPVWGRRIAVEQMFYNIILNAAQQIKNFQEVRNAGLIIISAEVLTLENRQWISLLFHDTGPGIHNYDFKNVFKVGFTSKIDGLGLGLDIVKNIAEDMEGSVAVKKSILFVGTVFEILLPIDD